MKIKYKIKLIKREDNDLDLFTKKKRIIKKKKFIRISEYRKKIREFNKIKIKYCLNNNNFKNIICKIKNKKNKLISFIKKLETRLDNIVYRIGFSGTRREARQLIVHKHIYVNKKKINKPSFEIKKNDIISYKKKQGVFYKNQINKFSFIVKKKCKIKSLGFYKNYFDFFNYFYTLSLINK